MLGAVAATENKSVIIVLTLHYPATVLLRMLAEVYVADAVDQVLPLAYVM
jgi:hypothetical protein